MAPEHPDDEGPTVKELEQRVMRLEAAVDRLQQLQKAVDGKLEALQHRVGLLDHRF